MKKFLLIVFALIFAGCYEPQKVTGHYYVKADSPVTVSYITDEGIQEATTAELDVYYTLEEDKDPEVFYYGVTITSETAQDVHLIMSFSGRKYNTDYNLENITTYDLHLYYCTPWNTSCAKVNVGI